MSRNRPFIVTAVALAAVAVSAERPLAVRVEVGPVAAGEGGTLVAVSVAVAPEDRGALGEDVMIWAELVRGGERVFRRGWALKVDDPERPLRVEAVWPPGAASLRVELEAAGGRGRAVWWGEVVVPDLTDEGGGPAANQGSAEAGAPGPEATTSPAIDPVPPPVLAGNSPEPSPVSESRPQAEPLQPTPTAPDRELVEEPEAPALSAPVATPRPQPLPTPDPEHEAAPVRVRTAPAAAALATVPLAPVYLEWPAGAAGDGELTVAAERLGRPATGLGPGDLDVRAGGKALPVIAVGGPDEAPLLLAVAVDLGPGSTDDTAWVGRMVGELAARAGDGRGRVLVRTAAGIDSGWGVDPVLVPELVTAAGPATGRDLPELVRGSLVAFGGLRGRAFLLVVTDGGDRGSDERWREAFEVADRTGVPILVAGLWNGDFGRGLRKDLRRLGDLSGGAVFYLQGAVQAGDLLERFGALVDGSVAVRVGAPAGTTGVEVRAPGLDGAEVRASTTVR